jgi:hypothetical protein
MGNQHLSKPLDRKVFGWRPEVSMDAVLARRCNEGSRQAWAARRFSHDLPSAGKGLMLLKNDAPISIFLRNIINYEKIVKITLVRDICDCHFFQKML